MHLKFQCQDIIKKENKFLRKEWPNLDCIQMIQRDLKSNQ